MTVVNDNVYWKFTKRVNFRCAHQAHRHMHIMVTMFREGYVNECNCSSNHFTMYMYMLLERVKHAWVTDWAHTEHIKACCKTEIHAVLLKSKNYYVCITRQNTNNRYNNNASHILNAQ